MEDQDPLSESMAPEAWLGQLRRELDRELDDKAAAEPAASDGAPSPELAKLLADIDQEMVKDAPPADDAPPSAAGSKATASSSAAISAPLASAPASGRPAGVRHIVFSLDQTRYAVPIGSVVEIGDVPRTTFVPGLPDWLRGVSNLRGEVVAVIDLRCFLGFAPQPAEAGRMLVARVGSDEVTAGLVVDEVQGLATVPAGRLAPPSVPADGRVSPFLAGMVEDDDRLLAVLDLENLLMSPEVRQFEPR